MSNEQPDYYAYLLRLWRETGKGQTAWRASLQSSLASERQVFASLDDLSEYLRQQTGVNWNVNDDVGETGQRRPHTKQG